MVINLFYFIITTIINVILYDPTQPCGCETGRSKTVSEGIITSLCISFDKSVTIHKYKLITGCCRQREKGSTKVRILKLG